MRSTAPFIQRRLAQRLRSLESLPPGDHSSVEDLFAVLTDYDCLAGELYRLRANVSRDEPSRAAVEEFMAETSHDLLSVQAVTSEGRNYRYWVSRYRAIWRRELPLFLFVLVLFLGTGLLGWNIVVQDTRYAPVLINQHFMETILDQTPWFERIRKNPFLYGVMIAWNNIWVAIRCFSMGALLGVGGLLILCYNGVFFGAIMGYCYVSGFHEELTEFVIGHGPLELTIIIASAFASLLYGRAFFMRPLRDFPVRFGRGARDAAIVIVGVLPWLVLAAILEVFVSPFTYLDFQSKLLLGGLCTLLFWLWTFWPENPQEVQKDTQY